MSKRYLCLLTVAILIVSVLIAGCTTSNEANQGSSQEASPKTSTSSTTTPTVTATTTTTSKTTTPTPTRIPTVTPSPSTSPTAATPTPSVMLATSIQFTSDPSNVAKGTSLGIDVTASGITICGHGAVTATIGTISSGGSSGCFRTAYLDTSGLNTGTYDVTLKFAGDSTYQASQLTSKITIS